MLGSSGVFGSDGLWALRMRTRYVVLVLNSGIHGTAFLPELGLSLRPRSAVEPASWNVMPK